MANTAQEIYYQFVTVLSLEERLRLATLILNNLVEKNISFIDKSDTWTEEDQVDLVYYSCQYSEQFLSEEEEVI